MASICITLQMLAVPGMAGLAGKLQLYLDRVNKKPDSAGELTGSVHVVVTRDLRYAPFRALSPLHIVVSMDEAREIARYARIPLTQYLQLCIALALVQRKALADNPLLIGEDLGHPADVRCLFNYTKVIQDYALEVEGMRVCGACREFYRCLKCESELDQVDAHLKVLRKGVKYSEK